jgi:hypothetical protein
MRLIIDSQQMQILQLQKGTNDKQVKALEQESLKLSKLLA